MFFLVKACCHQRAFLLAYLDGKDGQSIKKSAQVERIFLWIEAWIFLQNF